MIVYVVTQNDNYSEVGGNYNWMEQGTPYPNRAELVGRLKRSHQIWVNVSDNAPVVKKVASIIETMLRKVCPTDEHADAEGSAALEGEQTDSTDATRAAQHAAASMQGLFIRG